MKRIILIIAVLFLSFGAYSQAIIPSLSKNKILIGDLFTYSFKLPLKDMATYSNYAPIEIKDSLELVSIKMDTIIEDNKEKQINFVYTLTSFVEGKHIIQNKDGKSFGLDVLAFPIDTTKIEIKDIKANMKESFSLKEILPILIWTFIILLIIVGIFFAYNLWKKYRNTNLKDVFIKPKPKLPPHILALNMLEGLRLKRLLESGLVKEYYSELSDILREYLLNQYSIPAIEMTTDEILYQSKAESTIRDSETAIVMLEYILKYADLVKFAKYIPDAFIGVECMNRAIEFISQTKPIEKIEEGKEEDNV